MKRAVKNQSPTIFVVDDERLIAKTLATILSRHGFDAYPFFGAEDVLAILPSIEPDLVLSDVMMPGISGIELALRIRTLVPNCKILLFSGQAETAICWNPQSSKVRPSN